MLDKYIIDRVEIVGTDIIYKIGDTYKGIRIAFIESYCQEYGMTFYAFYDSNPNRGDATLLFELTGGCVIAEYAYCDVY